MSDLLSDDEIEAELPAGWARNGDEIVRTFEFDAYLDGVGFASGAGGLAEDAWHHPEITISWCEVTTPAGSRQTTSSWRRGSTTSTSDAPNLRRPRRLCPGHTRASSF